VPQKKSEAPPRAAALQKVFRERGAIRFAIAPYLPSLVTQGAQNRITHIPGKVDGHSRFGRAGFRQVAGISHLHPVRVERRGAREALGQGRIHLGQQVEEFSNHVRFGELYLMPSEQALQVLFRGLLGEEA